MTVAVLGRSSSSAPPIDLHDLQWSAFRGSGPGGQHRNKTETGVRVVHVPTGTSVRIDSGRSRERNRELAFSTLLARLRDTRATRRKKAEDATRRALVGSGMRGDKIRTIRVQDGLVTDHRHDTRIRFKDYARGRWKGLLPDLE